MDIKTKHCNKCDTDKPETDFAFKNRAKDIRQSACKLCMKVYKDQYYTDNKTVLVDKAVTRKQQSARRFQEYKKSCECKQCGENEPCCLDFHHLDSEDKDSAVSAMVWGGRSWESILEEIDKCVVVCRNCHAKIHAGIIKLHVL